MYSCKMRDGKRNNNNLLNHKLILWIEVPSNEILKMQT